MTNIKSLEELRIIRRQLKAENKIVVLTNGVFDLIHAGHIDYLVKAKKLGDVLIVALNNDDSVKKIKGDKRPILKEEERAFVVSNLKPVNYVVLFEEDTPANVIEKLVPDVLVKGADWSIDQIVGRDIVEQNGGVVRSIEFVNDQSTTKIIESIVTKYGK